MKKKTGLFFAILFIVILSAVPVFAEERVQKDGDYLYEVRESVYESGKDVAVLTSYVATSSNATVVVPSEIDGHEVEELQDTFTNRKDIKKIIVSEGIKDITNETFGYCVNLKSVTLPDSLVYLSGFKWSGIQSITIPENVERIAPMAFYQCEKLKTLKFLGKKIDSIGHNSFAGCTELFNIELPENIGEIEDNAFEECDKIKVFIIPVGTKTIGENIISGKSLEKIVNLSSENFYKETFWNESDDTYKWYTDEAYENEATYLPSDSTVYRKRVRFDYSETYANKYREVLSDDIISMSKANTEEDIIEYIKSKAPSGKPDSVDFSIAVSELTPAIAGTIENKEGQNGYATVLINIKNSLDENDVFEFECFKIIEPTPYTGGGSSSGGSSGGGSSSGGGGGGGSNRTSTPNPNNIISVTKESVKDGNWEKIGELWKLKLPDGSYASSQWAMLNEKWYLLGNDGIMKTDWQKVNGKWYYLFNDGTMLTGWHQINSKWYWMDSTGVMMENGTTPDGFLVNENGEWVQ